MTAHQQHLEIRSLSPERSLAWPESAREGGRGGGCLDSEVRWTGLGDREARVAEGRGAPRPSPSGLPLPSPSSPRLPAPPLLAEEQSLLRASPSALHCLCLYNRFGRRGRLVGAGRPSPGFLGAASFPPGVCSFGR